MELTKKQMKSAVKRKALQELCVSHLRALKFYAKKYKLSSFVDELINANKRGECVATTQEVDLLSRMVREDRINRHSIPEVLGMSYRECNDKELFEKIRNFGRTGTYSKNDAILLKSELAFEEEYKRNKKHKAR